MANREVDNEAAALFNTLERIRADRYPQLDVDLVRDVLRMHSDPSANPSDLTRALDQIIERYLSPES